MKRAIILSLLAVNAFAADPIVTESTNSVTTKGEMTTTVKSPPPSAISPQISTSNSDLCTVGVAGAVQTQILGISAGTTFTEDNCVRLKNAKTLYDMGMKVAAVSVMCQDKKVFDAMMHAGTPCPYDGLIGSEARAAWKANEAKQPVKKEEKNETNKISMGIGGVVGLLGLLLLL